MTDIEDLYAGLGGFISALDGYAWDPNGVYDGTQISVFTLRTPESPDRCLTVSVVPMGDDPAVPFGLTMIQFRARGARNKPLDAQSILYPIFQAIQGTAYIPAGPFVLQNPYRTVHVPLGTDDLQRTSAADQYYTDTVYPPTASRP